MKSVSEPFLCKGGCEQMVIYHEGQGLVVNWYDGAGGKRGDRHVCPHRMGSDPHFQQSHKDLSSPYPRKKASVILCPMGTCNKASVEKNGTDPLHTLFFKHLWVEHGIRCTKEYMDTIEAKILYFRERTHYLDPFLHVEYSDMMRNRA